MLNALCAPALIYLVFALTQVIVDLFKSYYNEAFFKFIQMIVFTLLLNVLCARGLGVISWMIVFIPFILMTTITAILILVFGLNPAQGDYTIDVEDTGSDDSNSTVDSISDARSQAHSDISDAVSDCENDSDCHGYARVHHKKKKRHEYFETNFGPPPEMNTTSNFEFAKNMYNRI